MGWCIGSLAQDPSVVGQHVSQTVRVRSFTSGHVHNSPAVMESVPGVVFNMGVLLSSLQLLGDTHAETINKNSSSSNQKQADQ